jgi:poly-gamma-glutamate synthesis protein (capsule biosynthesis protein)
LAAPFPTLTDEVALADVEAAWQDGRLTMIAETAAALSAWWGEPENVPRITPPEELVETLWQAQDGLDDLQMALLPFDRLTPKLKVLRVDGSAPIDLEFNPVDYTLTVPFGLVGEAEAVAAVQATWPGPLTNRDDDLLTTVAMSGPAGMRRAVADRMDKYGHNYPAEETGPVMQAVDIAHMSNENAFAPNCPPADPFDSDNVCNRDEYVDLMTWMGIDVNEMTGNHLNDWGEWAMIHTLDLYEELGIETFGGGYDLEDAAEPLLMEHNGNKIAFVGCNPTGPEFDWAGPDNPGSLPCGDYSEIYETIGELDAAGYNVIATLQYLEDYQYQVLDPQRQAFGALAEAGATAVSGSHGHHPQGFAFVDDGYIHYGMGNLLADQMWSMGGRQTFLDVYTFYDGRLLNVDLWTGLNEDYARIRKMTPEERADLLTNVFEASDW